MKVQFIHTQRERDIEDMYVDVCTLRSPKMKCFFFLQKKCVVKMHDHFTIAGLMSRTSLYNCCCCCWCIFFSSGLVLCEWIVI